MVTWVIFLTIGLVIGIAAGLFIGQLDDLKRKQHEEMQHKLESAEKELVDYKSKVTEHFVQTSVLVNNMTDSYKAIHDHLSTGAGTLCDSQLDVAKLNISEVNVIEKQVSTDELLVKPTNTQTNATNEQDQSAEQVLSEKVKIAGYGGQADIDVTESKTISDDEIREITQTQEQENLAEKAESSKVLDSTAENSSTDSSPNDSSLKANKEEEETELTAIPTSESSTNKDSEQKVEVNINRTVH